MRFIKMILLLALVLLFAFIGLAFITHNQGLATVDLLFADPIETKISSWLIGFFVVGAALGLLTSSLLLLREKAVRRRVEKRMQNTSKLISGYHS